MGEGHQVSREVGGAELVVCVLVCLERSWNMWTPGFGVEERTGHRTPATEAHKQVGGAGMAVWIGGAWTWVC